MRRIYPLAVAACLSWTTAVFAQTPERARQLVIAAQLPLIAAQARREGVPNSELRPVLIAMRDAKVPAHEAREIIDVGRAARREHGPVDNFGAFVQSRLQAGLRGRQLAAAIRAEHAARGKGGSRAAQAQRTKGKSGAAPAAARPTGQKGVSPAAKGAPATDKARPATGKGTPATGQARPATGKGTPTAGKSTPATTKGTPATTKGTPATDKKNPTTKGRPD